MTLIMTLTPAVVGELLLVVGVLASLLPVVLLPFVSRPRGAQRPIDSDLERGFPPSLACLRAWPASQVPALRSERRSAVPSASTPLLRRRSAADRHDSRPRRSYGGRCALNAARIDSRVSSIRRSQRTRSVSDLASSNASCC